MSDTVLAVDHPLEPADGTAEASPDQPVPLVRIYVCTTCSDRRRGIGACPGARLFTDLAAMNEDAGVKVVPVSCLCYCEGCTLSFAAKGKWTYVYSVSSDLNPAVILEAARLYSRSRGGLFAWEPRTGALRDGMIARVPPTPQR